MRLLLTNVGVVLGEHVRQNQTANTEQTNQHAHDVHRFVAHA